MHRRRYLRALTSATGAVALAAGAGCIGEMNDGSDEDADGTDGGGAPPGGEGNDSGTGTDGGEGGEGWLAGLPSVPAEAEPSAVDLSYPEFGPSYYDVVAEPAGTDAEPVPFADLSADSRLEVASAVARGTYVTDDPVVLDEDLHQQPVDFGSQTFHISVAVADRFAEAQHGPEGDEDWESPVSLETATVDGSFWVRLRNDLDRDLPLQHYGRPYFGALVAVGAEDVATLSHDLYDQNRFIVTQEPIQTNRVADAQRTAGTLAPGEVVTERYDVPADAPADGRVWCSVSIGDESIDLLGNRRATATGVASLE